MERAGFTFIEALLVLFIVTTILLVSQTLTIRHSTSMIDERTIAQFKYDVLLTQALAMREGLAAELKLESGNTYKITTASRDVKRILPESVSFEHSTALGRAIVFTNIGTTNASGKIYYKGLRGDYKLVVQLGRGRIRIEDT